MFNATVTGKKVFTPGLFLLRVRPDKPVESFQPGQYVTLGLPGSAQRPAEGPPDPENFPPDKLIRRAYSIASSPDEGDTLEFYIALVPEGLLTPRLSLLNEGDRLNVTPKCVGKFTLDGVYGADSLVFFSTGTGIAPFISMLRSKVTWDLTDRIVLLHGVRFREDLSYDSELRLLEDRKGGRFRYIPVVSREDPPSGGCRGYVQRVLPTVGIAVHPGKDHVFACGNPSMVTEVEETLCKEGFRVHSSREPGNLHLEKYW